MIIRNFLTPNLCLGLAVLLLAAFVPAAAYAVDAPVQSQPLGAPAPAATTQPAPAAKTVVKKTTKSRHKAKKGKHKTTAKKKTSAKKSTHPTASRKANPALASTRKQTAPLMAAVPVDPPRMARPHSIKAVAHPMARAGTGPSQVVQQFYNNLTETMKEGDSLGFSGRTARLQPAVDQSFDMNTMMRMAAGPSWNSASPEQQRQMVSAFRTFSVANYANRFAHYEGQKFEVTGEKQGANPDERIVETRLTSGGDKTDLNYLMRRNGAGQWKIVDVYVDGTISEMATRRSEFGSVLRSQGVDALLRLLDEKSHALSES